MTGGNKGNKDAMYSVCTFETVPNHVHFIALCLFRQNFFFRHLFSQSVSKLRNVDLIMAVLGKTVNPSHNFLYLGSILVFHPRNPSL